MTSPASNPYDGLIEPCPFCGKRPEHWTQPSSGFQCQTKDCALYLSAIYATVEQWNKRIAK